MNRRTFFGLILACLGVTKLKAKPVHTLGYLTQQQMRENNLGILSDDALLKGQSAADYVMAQQKAFSNRLLGRYEGRPIPPNIVFAQNCGRAKPTYGNTVNLETQKLKSITKE